jgi:hypothetical protein
MKKASLYIFIVLIIVACGDNSLFSPAETEIYSIDLFSLANGDIIQPEDPINFKLNTPEDESKPDRLEIILYTGGGEKKAIKTIENPNTEKDLTLSFPDLSSGQYKLVFSLFRNDELLAEETVSFFYAEGDYLINGVESFPSVIFPGDIVRLKADLDVPVTSNPFLRWSQNQAVLESGLLSDGLDNINWRAPMEEGVYSIRLEIFPIPPLEGKNYIYLSSRFMDSEVYISSSIKESELDLGPSDSYFSLFHLNGNLDDSGNSIINQDIAEKTASKIGSPETFNDENKTGFEFNTGDGILIPYIVLPISYGELMPFTMHISTRIEEIYESILTINSNDNTFTFTVVIDENSQLLAILKNQNYSIKIPSNTHITDSQKTLFLSLSVLPKLNTYQCSWFINGELVNTIETNKILKSISPEGETVIGGENGFTGAIDEFGVYCQSPEGVASTATDIYYNAMKSKYMDNLYFAEGFEGTVLPKTIKTESLLNIQDGSLELGPESEIELLPLSILPEGVSSYSLNIKTIENDIFAVKLENNSLIISNDMEEDTLTSNSFTVKIENGSIYVDNHLLADSLAAPVDEESFLPLIILNSQTTPLSIDSILIVKE